MDKIDNMHTVSFGEGGQLYTTRYEQHKQIFQRDGLSGEVSTNQATHKSVSLDFGLTLHGRSTRTIKRGIMKYSHKVYFAE